jgi:hypothetical protein
MAQIVQEKSQVVQCALTLAFGPIGLLYGSPAGGVALCFLALLLALATGGFGAVLVWPASIVFGFFAINRGNRRLLHPVALPEHAELPTIDLGVPINQAL